jgi:hypothetical protein
MSQRTTVGWGRVASGGALVGLMTAGAYALAFLGYAITRATATLLLTSDIDGGLAGTAAVTALSLAVPVAVFTALCALPAAGLGALTALIIRALLTRMTTAQGQLWAALLGAGVCVAVSLVLLALLAGGMDLAWTSGTAEALTFWLVLPLVLYTLAGALGSSRLQRLCHSGQANVSL